MTLRGVVSERLRYLATLLDAKVQTAASELCHRPPPVVPAVNGSFRLQKLRQLDMMLTMSCLLCHWL